MKIRPVKIPWLKSTISKLKDRAIQSVTQSMEPHSPWEKKQQVRLLSQSVLPQEML